MLCPLTSRPCTASCAWSMAIEGGEHAGLVACAVALAASALANGGCDNAPFSAKFAKPIKKED